MKVPGSVTVIALLPPKFPPLVAILLALLGCAERGGPVVRVGDVAIPLDRFEALGPPEQASLLDLAGFGSLVAEGRLDVLTEPVGSRAEHAYRMAALPYHLAADASGLTETELRAAYVRSPEWELEVRHAVRLVEANAPAAARDSARAVAERIASRAAAGEDFARLAAEFSEEPGAAARGGLLQPGRRGSWVDPFWNAAMTLAPGETSGVVETEYGFHVLRVDGRRPIPFEEADRTDLLRRVLPTEAAVDALAEWSASRGSILVDPPALGIAIDSIAAGAPPPDTLVVARGAGHEYTAEDMVVSWAGLSPEERTSLERGGQLAVARWVEDGARNVVWGEMAREMGISVPPTVAEAAAATRRATLEFWAATFGMRPGMDPATVYEAALEGTLSGTPQVRASRQELRSYRPWLRRLYPADLPDT